MKNLSSGIGHLLHMPGHAFTRSADGRYHDAVLANMEASEDDSNYIEDCSVPPMIIIDNSTSRTRTPSWSGPP